MPVWTDELRSVWSTDLETVLDFDRPIGELVVWRAGWGLETMIEFRRRLDMPYYPPSEYRMCSSNTQDLAEILTNYVSFNCCDDRPDNFYPLLNRIIAWMDTEYGDAVIDD